MPELRFAISGVAAMQHAAAPVMELALSIENAVAGERVRSILLRCQVSIEPRRRGYSDDEKARLVALFGAPERWGQTVQRLQWAQVTVLVPPFEGAGTATLALPAGYEHDHAVGRFLDGVQGGEVPLSVLFSGTVFYENDQGLLQAAQIPWSCEAGCALPASLWRATLDHYYPGARPLLLGRDTFDRLARYQAQRGYASVEQALETLLELDAGREARTP